ncbi:hypothetical protein DXA90_13635, partial [Clostridiaceae bacterium OF09-1]
SGCIQEISYNTSEISYNTSEEGSTILEYSDQIENKRSLDINYIILTPLKNDFTESEFLLCQYKKRQHLNYM